MKKIIKYYCKTENKTKKVKGFKFDYEGGLSDIKKKFSSVELQHKSLKWRY